MSETMTLYLPYYVNEQEILDWVATEKNMAYKRTHLIRRPAAS